MIQRIQSQTLTMTGVTGDTYTQAVDMDKICTLSVQSVIAVNTPSAANFPQDSVSTANDTITSTANGFFTGLKVRLTSTGTLPAPLATATDYFVIVVDANTYSLATSLANALVGTKIDITNTGTAGATGTATPTALAGGAISYQRSNITTSAGNPSTVVTDWDDIITPITITASVDNWYTEIGPPYRWFRIKATLTAGSMTINNYLLTRGSII